MFNFAIRVLWFLLGLMGSEGDLWRATIVISYFDLEFLLILAVFLESLEILLSIWYYERYCYCFYGFLESMLFNVFFNCWGFELFLDALLECKELKLEDLGETKNFLYNTKGDIIFPGCIFLSLIINKGISNSLLVSSNLEFILMISISYGFNEFSAIFL